MKTTREKTTKAGYSGNLKKFAIGQKEMDWHLKEYGHLPTECGAKDPMLGCPWENKTTREEELRMTLGNFATCRDSIGEDEEEFDARIGMAFGGRDKSKKQIDDLTDRAVSDIKHLLEKEREGVVKVIKRHRPVFIKDNIVSLMSVDNDMRVRQVLRIEILEELGVDCTKMRATLKNSKEEK